MPVVLGLLAALVLFAATSSSAKKKAPASTKPPLRGPPLVIRSQPPAEPLNAELERETEAQIMRRDPVTVSPLEGVPLDAWKKYVAQMRKASGNVAPASIRLFKVGSAWEPHFGAFLLGVRTLAHLGLMTEPKKVKDIDPKSQAERWVWTAKWKAPATLRGFLSDPVRQYDALVRHVQNHAASIRAGKLIGTPLGELGTATLSGLLAAARSAGLSGMRAWLKETTDKRNPNTTKAFKESNELF